MHSISYDTRIRRYNRRIASVVCRLPIFSSPEPKARDELIGWDSRRRPFMRLSTLSNMNISEADRNQISSGASLGWGLSVVSFGPDRIRTLVSMATDISHTVKMGQTL